MAKLKLLNTIFSKLGSLSKSDGQIIVSRDSKSLYVDLEGERIEITDWIDIDTEETLLAILTPLTNKYYYTKDTNKIWRYVGGEWKCLNDSADDLAPTYTESSTLLKLSSGEKLSVAFGKISKAITDLISHIGDSVKHITSTERTNWNSAKTHADSAHARTDATKVEKSSTNGNIKINGTETTVYTHPGGTNPHGTTKSDVGLGNVGNFKAVSTVASQGLSDTEKSNARANIGAGTSSFSGSYNDLTNKPTIPSVGNGTVTIKQAGTSKGTFTMNQSGNTTIELTDNNTTYGVATQSTNGLESAADKKKLDGIATGAEVNQNAFSNVVVGSTTIAADSKTDTLTLAGSNVTITPDATNDKVTIGITKANVTTALGYTPPTTNTTYGVATSSTLGLVKSGTDITVDSSGNVSVNDDSHNHVISNVDGLQSALDGKAASSHTHDDKVDKWATAPTDLNNAITPGCYRVNSGHANIPNSSDWGQLLVIRGGADTITQIYGDYVSGKLFTRSGNPSTVGGNGGWHGWHELISSNTIGSQSVNYANSAGSVAWNNVTSKPSTFTPASHTHSYLPLSGGTITGGLLNIRFSGDGNWNEGIRIHESNNWATIALCSSDNTGDTGTSANTWSIHNNKGNFYITRNGSNSSSSAILSCINNSWSINNNAIIHAGNIGSQSVNYASSAGNADTVDGHHFNWSGQSGQPTWVWGGNDSSNMYVYNPSNFSVNYANRAGTMTGSYTGNGGQQNPNYFGVNKVGFLMMNTTVNGDNHYKDWIIMDCYSGSDVGGATAIGVDRQEMRAFIMGSDANRTSWTRSAELITTSNISSQSVSNANTLSGFTNTTTTGTAVNNATRNGHVYVNDTSGIGFSNDGACYVQAYSTSWVHQIYGDYRTGQIAVRGKNNGTWQAWRKVLDSSNYTSYCTPANIGAATASHTHSNYLTGITKDMVTTALGYTPPTKDTNTWRPLGTTADTACAGNDSRLSNARPASDVYAWAKAKTKPTYTKSEVGLGNVDNTADSAKNVKSSKKLQTYKQGSTTETYGDNYPIYAQWRDTSHVKMKCDNFIVETDYATSAGSASSVAWNNISGKPSTYTPSSHTHTKSQITDFPTSLPASDVYSWAKASSKPSYSWSEITNKPSSFTPASHTHSYLPLTGGTVNGTITADDLRSVGGLSITCAYSSTASVSCHWKDASSHALILSGEDGLSSYLGWSGSSSYATVTTIRGRTCKYSNSSGTSTLSDVRLKKDFRDLDVYDKFFDSIEPCAFRMKTGSSGRYHVGYKAQQIEQALLDSGLTTQDFGGFIRSPYTIDKDDPEGIEVYEEAGIKEGDDELSLIYTEFAAMNTYQIQKCKKEISNLKNEIAELKNIISNLNA